MGIVWRRRISSSMLKAVSLLAPNAEPFYQAVVRRLALKTGLALDWCEAGTWQERADMLYAGEAHVGFLCGLLYVRRQARLRLLGAPVLAAPRYQDSPIYFTDVV